MLTGKQTSSHPLNIYLFYDLYFYNFLQCFPFSFCPPPSAKIHLVTPQGALFQGPKPTHQFFETPRTTPPPPRAVQQTQLTQPLSTLPQPRERGSCRG